MKKIRVFGLVLSVIALAAFLASCSNPAGPNGGRTGGSEECEVIDSNDDSCDVIVFDICGDADCNNSCGVILPVDVRIEHGFTSFNRDGPIVVYNPMNINYTVTPPDGGSSPIAFTWVWVLRFPLPAGVSSINVEAVNLPTHWRMSDQGVVNNQQVIWVIDATP